MEIVKKPYSSNPWRLVDCKGREIEALRKFEHPNLGWTTVFQPICGNTKKECEKKAMELLQFFWDASALKWSVCSKCEAAAILTERK